MSGCGVQWMYPWRCVEFRTFCTGLVGNSGSFQKEFRPVGTVRIDVDRQIDGFPRCAVSSLSFGTFEICLIPTFGIFEFSWQKPVRYHQWWEKRHLAEYVGFLGSPSTLLSGQFACCLKLDTESPPSPVSSGPSITHWQGEYEHLCSGVLSTHIFVSGYGLLVDW